MTVVDMYVNNVVAGNEINYNKFSIDIRGIYYIYLEMALAIAHTNFQ
jgi:hypothetical protein